MYHHKNYPVSVGFGPQVWLAGVRASNSCLCRLWPAGPVYVELWLVGHGSLMYDRKNYPVCVGFGLQVWLASARALNSCLFRLQPAGPVCVGFGLQVSWFVNVRP